MLEFAGHADRPFLQLLINHDDDVREFAYTAGAEKALADAAQQGWTVVSMQEDWTTIF